uniref:PRA1 family protein n=1 Tax=Opuntia streptacantha TaxID=393608 RepID=A0A7C8Z870_OPUST
MASSTAPPILPVSTPQPTTTTTTSTTATSSASPPPPSAFRAFISRLHDQIKDGLSQRRPWAELIDRTAFSKPESLSDASTRLRKNYSYFRVNYLALLTGVLALSLLAHPFSLLTLLALLAAWCFLYLFRPSDQPLLLFGRSFSDKETLGLLVILSVFVIFLTSVGSLLMSAVVIGVAIVCVHGAFRVPEDLFLDDQEPSGAATGFLSFLGGATKNVAVGAATSVPPRI